MPRANRKLHGWQNNTGQQDLPPGLPGDEDRSVNARVARSNPLSGCVPLADELPRRY
jgi:hypothetical protein